MILKNFRLELTCDLIYGDQTLDLHNCYEWVATNQNKPNKTLHLLFEKGPHALEVNPGRLLVRFQNVSNVWTKDHDEGYPQEYLDSDKSTVDLIGFSSTEMPLDSIFDKSENDNDCLTLITVTGKILRIEAQSAEVVTETEANTRHTP